jgi:predicted  nucleic acid-binding Zn-ribbon protein
MSNTRKRLTNLPTRKPRTRKEMIAFLTDHFRYNTMNSNNRAHSYAVNIKVRSLQLTNDQTNRVYETMEAEDCFHESGFIDIIRHFDIDHEYRWQIGTNGRSGGYAVLYQGGKKDTGHKSHCPNCGQRNFMLVPPENPTDLKSYPLAHAVAKVVIEKRKAMRASEQGEYDVGWGLQSVQSWLEIPEIKGLEGDDYDKLNAVRAALGNAREAFPYTENNRCGRCGEHTRINYNGPRYEPYTSGEGLDMEGDFEDWDTEALRARVNLVWEFDLAVEYACHEFLDWAMSHKVEEQTIMVPKTIKVAVPD